MVEEREREREMMRTWEVQGGRGYWVQVLVFCCAGGVPVLFHGWDGVGCDRFEGEEFFIEYT